MKEAGYFMNLFGVSVADMETVTAAAMSGGAPYADLYFEHTTERMFMLRDGKVTSGGISVDCGTGIRAVKGEQCGYSYCESFCLPDLLAAAKTAAVIGSCAHGSDAAERMAAYRVKADKDEPRNDFYPYLIDWNDFEGARMAQVLCRLDERIRKSDGRISKVIARISSTVSDVMMFNSSGELVFDERPSGMLAASIVFSDGKTTETRNASRACKSGAEFIDRAVDEIVQQLCEGIDDILEAGRPKGGSMPVVMAAGASGILLHEAMGHSFEADFNRKGQSVFSGRIGRTICPRGISIVDDATVRGNWGACNYDDEGVPGQKTYMVRDGVLESYLHDRISAACCGVSPTGNGRRESFRYNPIPRMRLTYMENGDFCPEEIISSVKKGIYVSEFTNGEVKIGEGDFTFYVKRGALIENGRLTRPIKDINIIGNGPRALADIEMTGNDLKIDDSAWICGKEQKVDVGCGMPTVLVKGLTIGGE